MPHAALPFGRNLTDKKEAGQLTTPVVSFVMFYLLNYLTVTCCIIPLMFCHAPSP